jgi:hypothetical protein
MEKTSWRASLALVVLACLYYPSLLNPQKPSYALCSSEGNNIHTVDKHDTLAQCIVIRKNRIADIGSLRQSTSPPLQLIR